MKKILFTMAVLLAVAFSFAQTYKTKDGYLYFNPNKDQNNKEYAAASKEATAVLKVETGDVALLVPMKTFHFNNALLEEHFNENYLHTNKYPNGTYKGKLVGFKPEMFTKDGDYNMVSEGVVVLHGVTKNFKSAVKMTVKGKTATFYCNFKIAAADYNIEIPSLVKGKLATETPLAATIAFKLN
jgi:hypothetical protein